MSSQKQPHRSRAGGFSMPEVMVSASLLALVVATSAQVYTRSGITLQKGSLRDAVHARIAEDLEELRRESWRWACEDGTEGNPWVQTADGATEEGTSPLSTSCTGKSDDADKPVAYKTGRQCSTAPCNPGELEQIGYLVSACDTRTTAERMQTDKPLVFPSGPTALNWSKNLPEGATPAAEKWATIQRTISVNANDANQLDVTYTTSDNSPTQVTVNASLVPQALGWCP
jgi:Tfp pilus assembly protein PilV